MAGGAVKVQGLRELQRAFRAADPELKTQLTEELRHAGDVVRVDARGMFEGWGGAHGRSAAASHAASGWKTKVSSTGGAKRTVVVAQTLRKGRATRRRPNWGALQMKKALLPARAANTKRVVEMLDAMLGRLGRGWAGH